MEEIEVNKYDLAKILNCVSDSHLIDTDCVDLFKKLEKLVEKEINELYGD